MLHKSCFPEDGRGHAETCWKQHRKHTFESLLQFYSVQRRCFVNYTGQQNL